MERLENRITPALVTPFNVRFTTNATGDIAIIANTLETATLVGNPGRTQAQVTAAQNGTAGTVGGQNLNNNDAWVMGYVNTDPGGGRFNSSRASLSLPPGANVLFAGLYWGANSPSPLRDQVLFRTPTASVFAPISGTEIGNTTSVSPAPFPPGPNYQGFANVTSLVRAAGNGTYTVANVQADLTSPTRNGFYAGWSLVVAYEAPGLAPRNLTVFDGYGVVQAADNQDVNINVSGFRTPPAGPVNARVGVVAYEGDLGITGDSMRLNSTTLSDAVTPATNFFNSGISNQGVRFTAKNPNFVNQLGFDAKIVQAPTSVIPNGATSATVTLTTTGDTYFPGVVTTSIPLYAPDLVNTKTFTDLTNSNVPRGSGPSGVAAGDILEYTVTVTNPSTSLDDASNVVLTDPIPANTTYVPGSLTIDSVSKTDIAGDDQAEFNTTGNAVVFRLGAGADATTGGRLNRGESTTITFAVQVNPGTPASTIVPNQATTAFTGVTLGPDFPLTSISNVVDVSVLGLSTTIVQPTGAVAAGDVTVQDRATLSGGVGFTGAGRLNFVLQDSSNAAIAGTSFSITVSANGDFDTPATPVSLAPGTYHWVVSFTGDANNAPPPAVTDETFTVGKASPTLDTSILEPRAAVATGDVTVQDRATIANGFMPTGTLNFVLQDSSNAAIPGTSFSTAVSGNGNYDTPAVIVSLAAGTYHWVVSYTGDANNVAPPDVTDETFTVGAAGPALTTTILRPTGAVTAGDVTVQDRATLSGGSLFTGAGRLNFVLEDSSNAAIAGTSFSTAVSANGDFDTPAVTVSLAADTYHWVVSFTGDANNAAPPTVTDEAFTVSPASPAISTTANPATAPLGGTLQDVAHLTGGFNPTGEFTFELFAPGVDPTVGPAAHTETVAVNGDGAYHTTVGFVANVSGTWHWVAAYTGDPNNNPISSGALEEPVTVQPEADIALTKMVQPSQVMFGQNVTFTLTVHNRGPDTATDVFVDDPLPPGLVFVAAVPSQGTYAPGTGLWMVGTLANGATATLHVIARVAAMGPLVNRAEAGADQFDPDLSNNVASEEVMGLNPAPIISKRLFLASADPPPAPPPAGPARPLPALAAVHADIVFINGLYEHALGRDANSAELAYWVNQLLLDVSRSAVARRV